LRLRRLCLAKNRSEAEQARWVTSKVVRQYRETVAQRSDNLSTAVLCFLDKGERQNDKCQSEESRRTCVSAVHPRIGDHGNPVVLPWRSAFADSCRFVVQPQVCRFV
jgi:hypothetical protein